MAAVPATSITMLKDLSSDASSVRWTEFFRKYEAPMRGFLHERFPGVDPDDAMQKTLIALAKALPHYRYTPDRNGHFRNYLIGILFHKALDILSKDARQAGIRNRLKDEPRPETSPDEEAESWKTSAMEVAVEQLMADPKIRPATREVFRHVALMHEPPEQVAAQFGITRNNVDQIKNRMIARLSTMIRAMTQDIGMIG